ncbi:MAG: RNA 3'-terminal phosphate cyclase [Candidatus Woesearchaeota archaeon]|jgi:RNA 3'-phosphate cyclase|nr:RNA 3'-terminal phosphate cyclase [Candidatus Woesearchaeota archaeon]MDP7324058.1 RNA 3'-terminal phosphate cyclase [Candidatus Woesearchaeota archaeon]
MIQLDGNWGEGGGAIVRVALALSTLTGKAFRVDNIRKGREKPGLKAQHLHCIKALQELCDAKATDAHIGSESITYVPGQIKPKNLNIDIGTAGSITLLLQAVLLPCLFGEKASRIKVTGGTDVAWSMPFDYFNSVLVPQLRKYVQIDVKLERRGYYPKGGGKVNIKIKPKFIFSDLNDAPPINLTEQGELVKINGIVHCSSSLARHNVAERIVQSAQLYLGGLSVPKEVTSEYSETASTGTGIVLIARYSSGDSFKDEFNPVILGTDQLGEKTKTSEKVGEEASLQLLDEINSGDAVDKHLADNLIPYLAIFGGRVQTSKITDHTLTNIYVCEKFLGIKFEIDEEKGMISVV